MTQIRDVTATAADTAAAILQLPNTALTGGGPLQDAFLRCGVASFHDACTWVHQLDYGETTSGSAPVALLGERRGTCTTKHGAIAALAAEMGLAVQKRLGFYRMHDGMAPGIGALLQPYGLPFVPMVHCFLQGGGISFDLTAGNRDGRKQPIEAYDFVVPVAPGSTREDFDRLYIEYLPRYYAIEPRLADVPVDTMVHLAAGCTRLLRARACE